MQCCVAPEGRPFGAALRGGEASRHLVLRWVRAGCGERRGKGALEEVRGDQEGECAGVVEKMSGFGSGINLADARRPARW